LLLLQTLASPFDWALLLRGAPAVPPALGEYADAPLAAAAAAAKAALPEQPTSAPRARVSRRRRQPAAVQVRRELHFNDCQC